MAIPDEPIDWLNFDITKFEYNVEERFQNHGFNFEDSFEQVDTGQLQRTPHLIDETDLLKLLRTEKASWETVASISQEICKYYDKCLEHFFQVQESKIIRKCSQNI